MSIEAIKWARLADVQKSTSKLVLMTLATMVRYGDVEWTIYASIDYLAKMTLLNRKTVITALARLRELGVLRDTGRRAGANRSNIVYRVCREAVPTIDSGTASHPVGDNRACEALQSEIVVRPDLIQQAVPGYEVPACQVDDMDPYDALAPETDGHADNNEVGGWTDDGMRIEPAPTPCGEQPGAHTPQAYGPGHPARLPRASSSSPPRASRAPSRAGCGHRAPAEPTRLPEGWELPERWRLWTQRERPHWSGDQIEAIATTFAAYMRSRPDDRGLSVDWFASWRLWVLREREPRKQADTLWQRSWRGILAKGSALGLTQAPRELPPHYKARVFAAAGLACPH